MKNRKNNWKAFLIGVLVVTVGFLVVGVVQGKTMEEMREYIGIYIISVVYFGVAFILFNKQLNKDKKLDLEEKERKMKRDIEDVRLIILVIASVFLICLASKSVKGVIVCVSFIVALGIIEVGLYIGHQNLKKDIMLINEKLKENK